MTIGGMIEIEVYAAGLRNPDRIMALALELDSVVGLRYKVDTNHDLVYMEFTSEPLTLRDLKSIFRKVGLEPRFVGAMPPEVTSKKKTQRLDAGAVGES